MNQKAPIIGTVFAVVMILSGCSDRSDLPALSDLYLGQNPPGDTACVFAKGIVSTIHHEHSRVTFSKDATELFWAVIPIDTDYQETGGSIFKLDDQIIWFSTFNNDGWTKPDLFQFTRETGGSTPALSADGKTFYYRSAKPNADPNVRPRPSQLWKVTRSGKQWGEPVHEDNLIPDEEGKTFMSFCFADNGNLYFDYGWPDESGEWWWYVYFSEYENGGYSEAVRMGSGINDSEASWCPWIAPDESYIIYSSHREGEFGRGDLYINFKGDDGAWSEPVNMGPAVNSEMQERFPSVSPDGKYLFFARHVPETFSDIYWVDARVIGELKRAVLE